jgi:hypothetical protein
VGVINLKILFKMTRIAPLTALNKMEKNWVPAIQK